jgi:predicted Zn-dependent peptidase
LFFVAPAAGHTTAENEKAFYEVLEKFKSQKVDAVTLARVKTKTRASLIRRLDSNSGLAGLLTANYAIYGDWRKLFTSLDELDRVTADDVQRVSKECFVPEKRTTAYLIGGAK